MTATFDRLVAAHPDRVGKAGYWADLDGYRVAVFDAGCEYDWSLYTDTTPGESSKFIVAGREGSVDAAWRAGCDALDAQQALTAQLAELDDEDNFKTTSPWPSDDSWWAELAP